LTKDEDKVTLSTVEVADSAHRHGVLNEDIAHAPQNPLRVISGHGRDLVIGPSREGQILEIVILDDSLDEEPVIIHAMPLRSKFHHYLR
jgi:hypothetical protein